MAKLARKHQKIFAESASDVGQFGSAQTGTKVITKDLDTIQALSAFVDGWSSAVLGGSKLPTIEERNAVDYAISYQLAYLFENGIPEYSADTTYYSYSVVRKTGTYELYGSLIDNNTGNALPSQVDNTNWKYLGDLTNLVGSTVPNASTTEAGIGELATTTEVTNEAATGGTGAPLFVTPATMRSHQGVAKAWILFDGSGTISITNDYNVSTISDLGTGRYRINFSTAMANSSYAVTASARATSTSCFAGGTTARSTNYVEVDVRASGGYVDSADVNFTIHGD